MGKDNFENGVENQEISAFNVFTEVLGDDDHFSISVDFCDGKDPQLVKVYRDDEHGSLVVTMYGGGGPMVTVYSSDGKSHDFIQPSTGRSRDRLKMKIDENFVAALELAIENEKSVDTRAEGLAFETKKSSLSVVEKAE